MVGRCTRKTERALCASVEDEAHKCLSVSEMWREVMWLYKLYIGPGNFKKPIRQHKVKRIGLKIVDNLVGNLV